MPNLSSRFWSRTEGAQRLCVVVATTVWRYHRDNRSSGHIWQGRFKSFPIQEDDHLLAVLRYVERNPLRAKLANKAENWHWSSAARERAGLPELDPGPVPRSRQWRRYVNEPQTDTEVVQVRESIRRGRPFGHTPWVKKTARKLGIESSLRPRGRPRKTEDD